MWQMHDLACNTEREREREGERRDMAVSDKDTVIISDGFHLGCPDSAASP